MKPKSPGPCPCGIYSLGSSCSQKLEWYKAETSFPQLDRSGLTSAASKSLCQLTGWSGCLDDWAHCSPLTSPLDSWEGWGSSTTACHNKCSRRAFCSWVFRLCLCFSRPRFYCRCLVSLHDVLCDLQQVQCRFHQLSTSALVSEAWDPHLATGRAECVWSVPHTLGICIGLSRLAGNFVFVSIYLSQF